MLLLITVSLVTLLPLLLLLDPPMPALKRKKSEFTYEVSVCEENVTSVTYVLHMYECNRYLRYSKVLKGPYKYFEYLKYIA